MATKTIWKVQGAENGSVEAQDQSGSGAFLVDGTKIIGPQESAIAAPTGGTTVDSEARTAISLILTALRNHGIIAT